MPPSPDALIERVRSFVEWNEHRFDNLDLEKPPAPIEGQAGWKRGKEYWFDPHFWKREIFKGDEVTSEEAARALRASGVLRTQAVTVNGAVLQALCSIRGATRRAHIVKDAILDPNLPPESERTRARRGIGSDRL